ncbi:hypothetical protein ACGC1H_007339 [Rhizoctonia solani]
MANSSTVNQVAQMEEMLRAMENRLSEKIIQSEQRMIARIDQLSGRVDRLEQTLVVNDMKALARALNSSAICGAIPLYPLPLPSGAPIPESQFPATFGDFRQLEGAPLLELLQLYQLEVPPVASLNDMLAILATHCGIAW